MAKIDDILGLRESLKKRKKKKKKNTLPNVAIIWVQYFVMLVCLTLVSCTKRQFLDECNINTTWEMLRIYTHRMFVQFSYHKRAYLLA